MKGTLVRVVAIVGLFLIAGIGFWSNRDAGESTYRAPRIVRELATAIITGDEKSVVAILEDRPDLANVSISEEPVLHLAARYNKPAIIECLLKHGADRNVRGQWNATALHWACWWGSKDAAEKLIDEGFAVEDRSDLFGSTPLLWVAQGSNRPNGESARGDFEGTAQMLIRHGASADTFNARGISAFSIASKDVAEILAKHGANPNTHPSTRPSSSGLSA